jgi:hypothetical protein
MTTNIKLFENWLAEEDAVETPPAVDATAAATTLTTTVKPGTPATAAPAKFRAVGRIDKNVMAAVEISSQAKPFDITKSTLTLNIVGKVVTYNYDITQNRFKIDKATKSNYQTVLEAAHACAGGLAQKSLTAIAYDALGQTKAPVPSEGWKTALADINNSLFAIIQAAGTTRYGLATGAGGLEYGRLTEISIGCEVNVDTLQPTGNYNYSYAYNDSSNLSKTLRSKGRVYAKGQGGGDLDGMEPVAQILKSIRDHVGLSSSTEPNRAGLKPIDTVNKVKELLSRLITNAQALAMVRPV